MTYESSRYMINLVPVAVYIYKNISSQYRRIFFKFHTLTCGENIKATRQNIVLFTLDIYELCPHKISDFIVISDTDPRQHFSLMMVNLIYVLSSTSTIIRFLAVLIFFIS